MGSITIQQRYAIRYSNGLYHYWDDHGEYDYTENIEEAHLVFSRDAANEIADVIKRVQGRQCKVVEVSYVYQFIALLGKRSK